LAGFPFIGRDDLLAKLSLRLAEPEREAVVVIQGRPGVGKSELAREFGRTHKDRYPGGVFLLDASGSALPFSLIKIGDDWLELEQRAASVESRAQKVIRALGDAPSLLIFDNASSPIAIKPWLPPSGSPCHVIVTSVRDTWTGWEVLPIELLTDVIVRQAVVKMLGSEAADRYGEQLVRSAGGLPVQLVPTCLTLAKAITRGRGDAVDQTLADETRQCFSGVYEQLTPTARLLLHAAAHLNPAHFSADELQRHLREGATWTDQDWWLALDACLEVKILTGNADLAMDRVFGRFLMTMPIDRKPRQLPAVRAAQMRRLTRLAEQVWADPTSEAAGLLPSYPWDLAYWEDTWPEAAHQVPAHLYGFALVQIGQFVEAKPWFERAIAEAEKSGVNRLLNRQSVRANLHEVGYCLINLGQFAEARPWFERAVAEARKGDLLGRISYENLGASLHLVACCPSRLGHFEEARALFEQAVTEKRKGDIQGRVDHQSVGVSMTEIGYCLSGLGRFAEARSWFEQAVTEKEKGDGQGRIDHESLGSSLHLVGHCLSQLGDFAQAQPWFERAITEMRQGDLHGRVDYQGLGASLHEVGYCLTNLDRFADAKPWFESAAIEKEKGDIHGRVDHESLGASLHLIGCCESSIGEFHAAVRWFERAAAAKQNGDIHGRVDRESLGASLAEVGNCLARDGHSADARLWHQRAGPDRLSLDFPSHADDDLFAGSPPVGVDSLWKLGDGEVAAAWEARSSGAER